MFDAAVPRQCGCAADDSSDRQFVAMLDGFRESGGLCRARELNAVMALSTDVGGADVAVLHGWITQREVICFNWHGNAWLPWFQFSQPWATPHAHLRPVLQELNSVYDPWEVGCWFARPNPWLSDRTPADALLAEPPDVLHAARAERFIAH